MMKIFPNRANKKVGANRGRMFLGEDAKPQWKGTNTQGWKYSYTKGYRKSKEV